MRNLSINTPLPEGNKIVPIIHEITNFYELIYKIGKRVPKRDRYGFHANIETRTLTCLELSIEAAFSTLNQKLPLLFRLKIEIEIVKRLVRLSHKLNIVSDKIYLELQERLQNISKMATGWLNYTKSKILIKNRGSSIL